MSSRHRNSTAANDWAKKRQDAIEKARLALNEKTDSEKKKIEEKLEEKLKENNKKELDEKMEKVQEEFRKKELEYQKQQEQLKKSLDDAKRKAEQ